MLLGEKLLKGWGFVFLVFGISQAGIEKTSALPLLPTAVPTLIPVSNLVTNPASQPQQNVNADSRTSSIAGQLLNLLAEGSVGLEGPASTETVFAITAPLTYNNNPGLAAGTGVPAWDFDPQAVFFHSAPLWDGILLTEIIVADSAEYLDNSGYNLNTISGQFQANFTDRGVHFDASPFVAYKVSYTVPANFSGHAWVNDLEVGYNFNRILGTGDTDESIRNRKSRTDPLEIDFNPGISQRWIETDDGTGDTSGTGSSALEIEVPFIYRFSSRFDLVLDLSAYTRYYDVDQAPENQDRVDQAFTLPLSLTWTMVPAWDLKIEATGGYTQQFSSVASQNVLQLNTGVDLLMAF